MVSHTRNLCSAFIPSKCTHTVVNTHTHTPRTHTRSSGHPFLPWRPWSNWTCNLLKGTSVVGNEGGRALVIYSLKGVVDWFFSRLDCVYGVQSSMCSCLFFLKTHYFSHNLPLFHTSLSLLWQTPRFISWFYEAPPSMGWDWLAGSVCCDWLNRLYCTSERPAPLLSGMCSGWIVNSGVVYNAYQFEPDWDPEDISE